MSNDKEWLVSSAGDLSRGKFNRKLTHITQTVVLLQTHMTANGGITADDE
jgi:hypothetical protein